MGGKYLLKTNMAIENWWLENDMSIFKWWHSSFEVAIICPESIIICKRKRVGSVKKRPLSHNFTFFALKKNTRCPNLPHIKWHLKSSFFFVAQLVKQNQGAAATWRTNGNKCLKGSGVTTPHPKPRWGHGVYPWWDDSTKGRRLDHMGRVFP